jgi:hypothetical protein
VKIEQINISKPTAMLVGARELQRYAPIDERTGAALTNLFAAVK